MPQSQAVVHARVSDHHNIKTQMPHGRNMKRACASAGGLISCLILSVIFAFVLRAWSHVVCPQLGELGEQTKSGGTDSLSKLYVLSGCGLRAWQNGK